MKKHLYLITWIIRRGKRDRQREMYIEADTAKEARAIFDDYYKNWRDPEYGFFGQPHAFHIEVRRIKDNERSEVTTMKIIAK